MAGYSGTPLVKKLGFKPGTRVAVLGAPPGYVEALGLPDGIQLGAALAPGLDLIQIFVTREAELSLRFAPCRDALATAGSLWVSWPKGKAKARVATDLDEGSSAGTGSKPGSSTSRSAPSTRSGAASSS